MLNENKIKIVLGLLYIFIVTVFLLIFFSHFSFDDFSSFELIKNNRNKLNNIKNSNILITSLLFLFAVIIWVLLLGFGSPVVLIGGFIFGKWIGTILVVFGLTLGATILYLFANYFLKEMIEKKFLSRFSNLKEKFKQNEFTFFFNLQVCWRYPFFYI